MKVFIGYDPRQPVAFQVCAQSAWEHASKPIEIIRLELSKLPIKRRGLTEFTYSRFLVPYLSKFEGSSLFLDSDILVRGDLVELFESCIVPFCGVRMVQHERAFERPSVMLFNNPLCRALTPEFIEREKLFDFKWTVRGTQEEGKVNMGGLPKEWNHLVGYDAPNPDAKIVHFTMGIPVWKETVNSEFSKEWIDTFRRMTSTVSFDELMGRSVHVPHLSKLASIA